MPYLREDAGQDQGLRVLQGFLLAIPWNLSRGEPAVLCGSAIMISKQGQGETQGQSRSQTGVLSSSLLTPRFNPRFWSVPLPARTKHTIKLANDRARGRARNLAALVPGPDPALRG